MSLNTKQKLAVAAVVGGLVTLPMVYASRNSTPATEDQATIQNLKNNNGGNLQPPMNGIISVDTGKVTQAPSNNGGNIRGEGPAAHNSLTSSEFPANNQQGKDSINQFINNGHNFNSNTSVGKNCQFSPDAIKADVKHYWFKEASRGDLEDIGGGRQLTHEAADALRKLQEAARADGVTLTVGSAFRPVSYQAGIVARKKAAGQSDAQIYKVSSAPGYSEHHTGYALDFSPINNGFATTKAYTWLKQHGKEYGWEQSFTPESVRNTHVAVESWHWKYKGSPTAKAALANDACYFQ